MRVLITGAYGFIGVNLLRQALRVTDWDFVLMDHEKHAAIENILEIIENNKVAVSNRSIDHRRGDIRDPAACHQACESVDAIVHLAAETNVVASQSDPQGVYETNVRGTLNLLMAACQAGVRGFVFASSNAAVGEVGEAVHEGIVPRPCSLYGASKLSGEALCFAYDHCFPLQACVLRFANVYGPFCQKKSSVVAQFIREILREEPVTIYGSGEQTRDFTYVTDVCDALIQVLEEMSDSGTNHSKAAGQVFQVGTGRKTRIIDLIETLRGVTGIDFPVVHAPERRGEIVANWSSCAKIRETIGWSARTSLDEGVRKTWEWVKRRRII